MYMPELFDPFLIKTLEQDKHILATTKVPIITVSSSYKEDLKDMHGFPADETTPDIVFSRAHYSMALAIATTAWENTVNSHKAWIVDPTNYVSKQDWKSIVLTEGIGKTIARNSLLKIVKDLIDTFGRKKLPILGSITPPLLYLSESISGPILSLHIAAGNILASQGKTVLQVITDPHVRDEYVQNSFRESMYFSVFDEHTKTDFLEKAKLLGIKAIPENIFVTGAPIDPRVLAAGKKKHIYRSGPVKLCITTGGLGTNKPEIETILEQLLPLLRKKTQSIQLLVYCSTHNDIYKSVLDLAKKHHLPIFNESDENAPIRVLYHPQIVNANEKLITFGFPWADGFITKPSGDMAYDAAASGSFLLTLAEWGPWEENIQSFFAQKGISRKAIVDNIALQIESLTSSKGKTQSWVETAMHAASSLPAALTHGSRHILDVFEKIKTRA